MNGGVNALLIGLVLDDSKLAGRQAGRQDNCQSGTRAFIGLFFDS